MADIGLISLVHKVHKYFLQLMRKEKSNNLKKNEQRT